jgi:hypothetical protein
LLKIQSAGIYRFLQLLSLFPASLGGKFGGLEPAVLLYLVITDRNPSLFGAHDDNRLILALYLPAFTPDKKLANIKFSHYYLPLDENWLLTGPCNTGSGFFDLREYGST